MVLGTLLQQPAEVRSIRCASGLSSSPLMIREIGEIRGMYVPWYLGSDLVAMITDPPEVSII